MDKTKQYKNNNLTEIKFLNNSVNYSEEYMIKKTLYKYIETYNKFLYNYNTNLNLNDKKNNILIPNNNKKYYLYITKKSTKNTTLFFYPDLQSKKYFNDCLLTKNTIDEFFLECDLIFDDNFYLLEGYLYGDVKKCFLITDIIFKGDTLVEMTYIKRFELISKLFFNKISKMANINNLLSIGIHSYIPESMLYIYINNFIWKNEIISVETIYNFEKTQRYFSTCTNATSISNTVMKKIVKTKTSDVYEVYNINTNNFEGILYVNTLKKSKHLLHLFKELDEKQLLCQYNKIFQKWETTENDA
jgi:hypothetical protein